MQALMNKKRSWIQQSLLARPVQHLLKPGLQQPGK
jgi:hypothetical protein